MNTSPSSGGGESRGFVFLCWGNEFVKEACAAARSVRAISQYPCALITAPGESVPSGVFDEIMFLPLEGSYRDKILMRHSPYDRTVFLDTDTHVLRDFGELFDALNRFDILYQATSGGYHYTLDGIPMSVLAEPSAGIIAWRRNVNTKRFFELWDSHYLSQQHQNGADGAWDQRSMRAALYDSDAHVFSLPKEWQVYGWETSVLLGEAKMIHGRDRRARFAAENVNRSNELRLYLADIGFILPLSEAGVLDYLRLMVALFRRACRKATRLALHRSGLWRLPHNRRRM